ncbi:cytochrome o ubiquinol oxidase subunit I [Asticcacaulis taihuensis]|uniref:Cytochrome bo3 quinol oxidase subunit 1 apoprotein n=2 Tax=Asticcacaulis taihuensis TaxID=260084 RepID=A0A1G4PZI0_9CAUL|nr:cytochrome o ubiquinol oxidase subunit I [Asticcacaulis taihuensis]SCW37764.1 cytochrome bo3 quinol oxidase subunit 1 apoprotein [Asticcacaulis taihuensis]
MLTQAEPAAHAASTADASPLVEFLFGKLRLDSVPWHEPIIMVAGAGMVGGAILVLGLITYFKQWKYLWTEWLTSVDHKKIGAMYIILALIMLLRGFADALMMRSQQALASNGGAGYLPPDHFDQIFSAHGVIMIFFMAMPFVIGLMNVVMPLQIGARDVAFPYLNSMSFWLTAAGAILINVSLVVGEFSHAGWLAYPPFSELEFSPGVGVDYYIWALQISGLGTLLSGVNLITTIFKMRAPGMTLMRMPVFTWTTLVANVLIVAVFPILTVTLALLGADRYLGMHFFTNDGGGNPMMYVNLIWAWGHPEVYILILPAFGVFSEVVATFSRKRLFGYDGMVYATAAIGVLSFLVWLHHFFTMGAGANVNAFFGISTMVISIPTGVKIFNWLFTMYRGRIRLELPMMWTLGFIITFVIGGMTGVLLAVPGADFVLHNSVFLIAHFHNVIIGGVVFGCLAGLNYWFPKAFGFKLHAGIGKVSFWCWLIGFWIAFLPIYALGLMGMTRRLDYVNNPVWHVYLIVALCGALLIFVGIIAQLVQIVYSIWKRDELRDLTGDPWDGRTLEWATSSPPPFYNFAVLPKIGNHDAFWDAKQTGTAYVQPKAYEPIHMPHNTPTGFLIGIVSAGLGFGLVWHIWWMASGALLVMIGLGIVHTFNENRDYYVPADEVKAIEDAHFANLKKAEQ